MIKCMGSPHPPVFRCDTFEAYHQAADATRQDDLSLDESFALFALGLAGEAGEVTELVKKALFHGHPLDTVRLRKEIGDVLWYLTMLADAAELTLAECAAGNIDKLRERYPQGFFSSAASLGRKTEG